ncbi:MAG TPA: hypothetical protein VMT03_20095 [Polyangia bacterium]|nr:hypothetical protein [Polyangia bacterium]
MKSMAAAQAIKRVDATSVRVASGLLGTAMGVIWVVALAKGATSWLAWLVCLAALACFGTISLVPERRSGFMAAGNLALTAAGLAACWVVGLLTSATTWLVWLCFVSAGLVLVSALATALAAAFDRFS